MRRSKKRDSESNFFCIRYLVINRRFVVRIRHFTACGAGEKRCRGVGRGRGVIVGVAFGVAEGVGVGVAVAVALGVAVTVGVGLGVGVTLGVASRALVSE